VIFYSACILNCFSVYTGQETVLKNRYNEYMRNVLSSFHGLTSCLITVYKSIEFYLSRNCLFFTALPFFLYVFVGLLFCYRKGVTREFLKFLGLLELKGRVIKPFFELLLGPKNLLDF